MGELGLLACVVATLFGLARVFGEYGFLGRLALIASIAVALAALLRRRGVGMVASVVIQLLAGLVVIANVVIGQHVSRGVPTVETWRWVHDSVPPALTELRTAVPPVSPSPGVLVFVAGATWLLIMFADGAAFRAGATVQAVIPFVAAFLALSVPKSDFARLESVTVFAAAVGFYALAVRHRDLLRRPWLGDSAVGLGDSAVGLGDSAVARRASMRLAAPAASIGVIALLGAVLGAAVIPAPSPLVNLRSPKGSGGREVTTPFVSIRSLLGDRSDSEMFTVTSPVSSYWRLTALDTFDVRRDIWISAGKYSSAAGALARSTDSRVQTARVTQSFDIRNLGGPWIPSAFEASAYSGGPRATYNPATSTLFASGDLGRGDSYRVTSEVPQFDPDALDLDEDSLAVFDPVLLVVPEESSAERAVLANVVPRRASRYQQLRALQDWFRSEFVYDESVDYSGSDDPITEFLTSGRGFCQQFSSVFAIMARRLGLPSRVAVGFTMGEEVTGGRTPAGSHTFLVKGRYAHAWPEVYFPDTGWVPFEPTPGRGNPATTAVTGAAGAQATPNDGDSSSSTTSTTMATTTSGASASSVSPSSTTSTPSRRPQSASGSAPTDGRSRRNQLLSGAGLLIVALGSLGVLGLARRRASARSGSTRIGSIEPDDPIRSTVASAWSGTLDALRPLIGAPHDSETPLEYARRASTLIGRLADDRMASFDSAALAWKLDRLATIETIRRYATRSDVLDADEAITHARAIGDQLDRLVEGVPGIASAMSVGITH